MEDKIYVPMTQEEYLNYINKREVDADAVINYISNYFVDKLQRHQDYYGNSQSYTYSGNGIDGHLTLYSKDRKSFIVLSGLRVESKD